MGRSLLRLRPRPCPEQNANRRSSEAERLAQLIFQVALIAKMHRLGVIDEEGEGRWVHLCLGGVEHLQRLASKGSRTITTNGFLHHLIDASGTGTKISDIIEVQCRF